MPQHARDQPRAVAHAPLRGVARSEFMDDDVVGAMKPAVAQTCRLDVSLRARVERRRERRRGRPRAVRQDPSRFARGRRSGLRRGRRARRESLQLFPSDPGSTVYDSSSTNDVKWTPWTKTKFRRGDSRGRQLHGHHRPDLGHDPVHVLIDVFARHGVDFLPSRAPRQGRRRSTPPRRRRTETCQYQFTTSPRRPPRTRRRTSWTERCRISAGKGCAAPHRKRWWCSWTT